MTALSTVIKKELKQTFPNIKFSVTTRNDDVSVKWELPLGTDATVAAVKAICEKHETIVHHGDLMNDTAWSSGSSVYTNPSYTQERKDWVLEQTKARNFVGAFWNEKQQRFEEADGRNAYHATKQYHEYLQNGVSCALINEYGGEPSDKFWYYERLKEDQVKLNPLALQSEPEQVEPEIEAPIVPLRVYKVENEVYVQANFPSGNKRHWINEYRSQPTNVCQAKIVKVVHLTHEDYQRFIYSFLNDQEWLAGEGGSNSHYVSEKYGNDWDKLFSDELETEKWRRECYEMSVLVTDDEEYVLANPEGHNYARYVGLPHERTLESIIGKTDLKLATASPETVAISQLRTQAEEPQPEGKSEVLGLDSCVITEKYRIKVTDIRTETVTGQLLDDKDNLILEYGHPVYVCVRKSEILSSEQSQPEPEILTPAEPETNLIPFPSPKQLESQPVAQSQGDNGNSFYLQSYQGWVNKLVARSEYGKIKSFDEWYSIAVEVM